ALMPRCEMIEVLARVGLVAHQEALSAKSEVLNKDRVARDLLTASVHHMDAPDPDVQVRVQPQTHLTAKALLLRLPDDAIVSRAYAPGAGAKKGKRRGLCSAGANEEASHCARDRRPEDLVDQDSTIALNVLESENRAVWQDAETEAGGVRDPDEAEVIDPRRRQDV